MPDRESLALPRDRNGIVIGVWRVFHRRDDFNGALGPISFELGVAKLPVAGALAARLRTLGGSDYSFEPWQGPYPPGWSPPPGVPVELPADVAELFGTSRREPPTASVDEPSEPSSAPKPALARKPIRR